MKKIIFNAVLLTVFSAAILTIVLAVLGISQKINVKLYEFDWSGVSGVMDVVMAILTFILLLGLKQGSKSIDESTQSRNAELLNWAMAEMTKLKPAIRIVTDAHKRVPYSLSLVDIKVDYTPPWTKEELEAAQVVSVALQRMGYFATHNLVSKNHFLNLWGTLYLSCWYSLEGWVKHKRLQLDEPFDIVDGAYSRLYFEKYAVYCEEHLPKLLFDNTRAQFGLDSVDRLKGIPRWIRDFRANYFDNADIH